VLVLLHHLAICAAAAVPEEVGQIPAVVGTGADVSGRAAA
jgi:hypothetical protein